MAKKYDAIVIGAGLGGVAAALRLRKMGMSVLVLEKNDTYGGKLSEFKWGDYRWDKGPSLFTLPTQVDELFELFGKNPRDFFNYHVMDESCHYHFQDGTEFIFHSDPEQRNAELIQHFDKKNGEAAIAYIEESKKTYKAIGDLFIDHAQYGLKNIFDRALLKRYPMLITRKLMGSLDSYNKRKFDDPNLVRVFNRYATYNGSDPHKMSGLYSMIPHLEMNDGTYFPTKGMRSIVGSLHDLAVEQGVDFKFGQSDIKFKEISKNQKEITAEGDRYLTNKVVSAIDCVNFYKKVADEPALAKKYGERERSASAVVFYWAVEKVIPELKLHNIFFGGNYEEEFKIMFDDRSFSEVPTVYVHISSTINPEDAPANGQNWFVMINVPAGVEVTANQLTKFRKYVHAVIQKRFGIDIAPHIKHEAHWDQSGIGEYTGAHMGALYGASSNSKVAAIKRHGNASKKFKNVYFCGGTVHPGGGIPLVLKSAKIVEQLIKNEK